MSGLAGRGGQGGRNVDVVSELLATLCGDDPRGAADLLDPGIDVETERDLPAAGTFHGQPGFLRWLERWLAAWERDTLRVEMIEPIGERHVVASVLQEQRSAEGAAARHDDVIAVSYVCELRSGHPVRLHAHSSRRAAIDSARKAEKASDAGAGGE